MRSETDRQDSATACFAADTAMECDRKATWRVETTAGTIHACDRHLRLIEIKCARAGLLPRLEPEWLSEAGLGAAAEVRAAAH